MSSLLVIPIYQVKKIKLSLKDLDKNVIYYVQTYCLQISYVVITSPFSKAQAVGTK